MRRTRTGQERSSSKRQRQEKNETGRRAYTEKKRGPKKHEARKNEASAVAHTKKTETKIINLENGERERTSSRGIRSLPETSDTSEVEQNT